MRLDMPDLPVVLRVAGRRCVVVGGGAVAARRAASLHQAGAEVVVVAIKIDAEHEPSLLQAANAVHRRPYQPSDLDDALLVVAATDDTDVNASITADARARGVLVNRCDEPTEGDLTIPAHAHHGPITVAVHTSGISAAAAGTIRRELSDALDPAWPELLAAVAPYREALRSRVPDPALRRRCLVALTDEKAMALFKQKGTEAMRQYCQQIVDKAQAS